MTIDPLSVPYAGEAILEAPLREIFPDERRCFVPWLEDQLDLLGHAVCLDLEWEATEAEAPIGGEYPRADLLCTDRSSRERVIIEAQLGHLDNEHIGKAPVYLNAFESRSMIWVVPRSGGPVAKPGDSVRIPLLACRTPTGDWRRWPPVPKIWSHRGTRRGELLMPPAGPGPKRRLAQRGPAR